MSVYPLDLKSSVCRASYKKSKSANNVVKEASSHFSSRLNIPAKTQTSGGKKLKAPAERWCEHGNKCCFVCCWHKESYVLSGRSFGVCSNCFLARMKATWGRLKHSRDILKPFCLHLTVKYWLACFLLCTFVWDQKKALNGRILELSGDWQTAQIQTLLHITVFPTQPFFAFVMKSEEFGEWSSLGQNQQW